MSEPTQPEPQAGPVVKVARDLSEIVRLADALEAQAVARANDHLMPGGLAMVALGPATTARAQDAQVEVLEAWWWEYGDPKQRPDFSHLSDEDDSWEPPLETIRWWSEERRTRYDYPLEGRRATLQTEAAFLKWALDAMWRDEPKWDDFAKDIERARTRIENLLSAGERAERGVPCMYEECKGARLTRKLEPARAADGSKTWRFTDWRCRKCQRTWPEDRYAAMVTAANERAKFEDIDGEVWSSVEYAARKVDRSPKTIRTWVNEGHVAQVCLIAGRRVKYVNLGDVEKRNAKAKRRIRAA